MRLRRIRPETKIITLKINAELFGDARRTARDVRVPVSRYLVDVIESFVATRRLETLPPPAMTINVRSLASYEGKRRRLPESDDRSGPLNTHTVHLPRRG